MGKIWLWKDIIKESFFLIDLNKSINEMIEVIDVKSLLKNLMFKENLIKIKLIFLLKNFFWLALFIFEIK